MSYIEKCVLLTGGLEVSFSIYKLTICVAFLSGHVVQSIMYLTADPGVTTSILAWPHTFTEIDHEIISTAIFLP